MRSERCTYTKRPSPAYAGADGSMIGCQLDIVKVHTINALFCCEALMVSIETTGHRGYSAAIAHSCPTVACRGGASLCALLRPHRRPAAFLANTCVWSHVDTPHHCCVGPCSPLGNPPKTWRCCLKCAEPPHSWHRRLVAPPYAKCFVAPPQPPHCHWFRIRASLVRRAAGRLRTHPQPATTARL